jgi:hypothetical protein
MRSIVSLLRNVRRRFGITAPRVAIRTHVPWYLRWVAMAGFATLLALAGWATYDFGRRFAGFDQGEASREFAAADEARRKLEEEVARLRGEVDTAEQQRRIEQATFGDLAKQVKALAQENAALKDDLAFFQALMKSSGNGKEGDITLTRAEVRPDAMPGEYRYRVLLLQTGQRTRDFVGSLQLVVNAQQDARRFVVTLPEAADKAVQPSYRLSFKAYQRVEGTFRLPAGATAKSVQIRVTEDGAKSPRLTQTVNIS